MTLKSFRLFIYVNTLMAFLYITTDYFSWMQMRNDFQQLPSMPTFGTEIYSLVYHNVYYSLFFREIQLVVASHSESWYQTSNNLNLPLLIFIAAMIINVYLVFRMTKENTTKT